MFIEDKALDTLAHLSDGDARAALNGLQMAVLAQLSDRKPGGKESGQESAPGRLLVTEKDVKEGLQRSHILYDRAGEAPGALASFCPSMSACRLDACVSGKETVAGPRRDSQRPSDPHQTLSRLRVWAADSLVRQSSPSPV